jgi:hypothetical protein
MRPRHAHAYGLADRTWQALYGRGSGAPNSFSNQCTSPPLGIDRTAPWQRQAGQVRRARDAYGECGMPCAGSSVGEDDKFLSSILYLRQ